MRDDGGTYETPCNRTGHRIILWTCRAERELVACEQWLIDNRVPFDAINANLPERVEFYGGSDTRKVSADLYLDDKVAGAPDDPVELWRLAGEEVAKMVGKPP
ncbi:MAG: hypothetical protein ACYCSN_17530 [Acidobacteriaceae bacterium]